MKTLSKTLLSIIAILSIMNCSKNTEEQNFIGPAQIQIQDGTMTPETLLSFGKISDPQLSPDGQTILYGVTYTSIKDNRSCRNLCITDLKTSQKTFLTKDAASISNARWSADGTHIYFIQKGQIFKAPYSNGALGKRTAITDIKNGINEFSLSPDNTKIIYTGTVKGNVSTPADTDPTLDKAKAYVTEDLMYRHWDHWTTEIPQTYISQLSSEIITENNSYNLLGEDAGKYELPLGPFGDLAQAVWSKDSRYIAYSCKKLTGKQYAFSTNTEIYIYNIATKQCEVIPMKGGYDNDPVWSNDSKKIIWTSMRRDGYEADKIRLMTANINNGKVETSSIRSLTDKFKYNAVEPAWSKDDKYIYFSALAEGIQAIFRIDIATDEITRITSEKHLYDFHSAFGIAHTGEKTSLLATYCSMNFPYEIVKIDYDENAKESVLTQITHENEHIISQLDEITTEARYVKTIDGKQMLTWVLYPPKFDKTKTYPAIEILLGGPQGTLSQSWSYRWNYRLMASQGYVVVLPNRRGTTAFGQEWTEQISGDYSGLNMQDYLSAAKMIKSEPYIGKLAACGASYGGYSVYYLAGIHNNIYDCFIAHAGIFDEKYMYYETEEMWFPNWDNGGLEEYSYREGKTGPAKDGITFGGIKQGGSPWSNKPKAQTHYAKSPDKNITKWNTPILCIHGCMDFRIPYDQGMAAFNAAQMMGVPSKLIIFPEENHWILKPQNSLFWHREYFDWLQRWCK